MVLQCKRRQFDQRAMLYLRDAHTGAVSRGAAAGFTGAFEIVAAGRPGVVAEKRRLNFALLRFLGYPIDPMGACWNPRNLQTPRSQRSLCGPRVCLNPEHGLFGQALGAGEGREAGSAGAGQGGQDKVELLARVAWVATQVSLRLDSALVVDAGPLGGFGCFGLCLGGGSHERNQRIPDSALHRVGGGAIERHAVDDRLDDDSAAHELPDRVHHVGVVTPKAVNPANHERVACAQHVE